MSDEGAHEQQPADDGSHDSATVPLYSADEVRAAERPLLKAGAPLMARAAKALARVVRVQGNFAELDVADDVPRALPTMHARHVLILAGKGDNGADALYAGAELAEEVDVDVLLVGTGVHESALAAATAAGVRRVELPAVRDAAADYDVVIDGILGLGGSGHLRGSAREAVEALLPAVQGERTRVVAVDLPSGLDADTGEAGDTVLPATVTVTFGAMKHGLVRERGPELAGRIVLVDIGLELTDADDGRARSEVAWVIESLD